ncbi:histidine kinase [Flavitalea sp. BT771]|uniref:sensor histidine kinase n=1 Tax=Flavitalea sp. BT771 TaxID=3063329 RepID=UPI0026E2FA8F|nr:histidine kinase [Flavitalea sp. BT771]MDO6430337.1 histidine kinase [Flavitalea sp. BT771]MDV6219523.1 histidine kinase [Flavitalea sp. BT771]
MSKRSLASDSGPWYSGKGTVILLHALAWAVFFSLPYLLRPPFTAGAAGEPVPDERAIDLLQRITDAWLILSFYLNALIWMPRFFHHRRYGIFIGAHLVLFLLLAGGNWLFIRTAATHTAQSWRPILFFSLFSYLFVLACSTAFQLTRDRLKAQRLQKEKENVNLRTELSFLRSQVSPHFMFNVLNNMVALARKRSEELEPSLIKLSRLMRYMLYETDEEKVSLEKEIEYLQAYIDLQSQRFGHQVKVKVDIEIAKGEYVIGPMLLIPFVENAFKHGTGMVTDAEIDIQLKAGNGQLCFLVRNKFDPASTEVRDNTKGIGLPNVQRRLNLLYDQKHCLLTSVDKDYFLTSLKIQFEP